MASTSRYGDVPNIAAQRRRDPDFAQSRATTGRSREYDVRLRKRLHEKFPDMVFFFEPANITNQILNFGLPAPIDVQVVGTQRRGELPDRAAARGSRSRAFPARPTCTFTRWSSSRRSNLNVDRVKAGQLGLTQRDVTSSLLISLSGSGQVAPS